MHLCGHSALCTGSNCLHFSLHENICSRFTLSFDQPRMIGTGRGALHEAPRRAQTSVRDPSAYLRTHLHTKPRSLTQHTHTGLAPHPPFPLAHTHTPFPLAHTRRTHHTQHTYPESNLARFYSYKNHLANTHRQQMISKLKFIKWVSYGHPRV